MVLKISLSFIKNLPLHRTAKISGSTDSTPQDTRSTHIDSAPLAALKQLPRVAVKPKPILHVSRSRSDTSRPNITWANDVSDHYNASSKPPVTVKTAKCPDSPQTIANDSEVARDLAALYQKETEGFSAIRNAQLEANRSKFTAERTEKHLQLVETTRDILQDTAEHASKALLKHSGYKSDKMLWLKHKANELITEAEKSNVQPYPLPPEIIHLKRTKTMSRSYTMNGLSDTSAVNAVLKYTPERLQQLKQFSEELEVERQEACNDEVLAQDRLIRANHNCEQFRKKISASLITSNISLSPDEQDTLLKKSIRAVTEENNAIEALEKVRSTLTNITRRAIEASTSLSQALDATPVATDHRGSQDN